MPNTWSLSSDVFASKLLEHFTVDVKCLRQLLNKDTLTQPELVVLCHHTIGLGNKNVSSKRKGEEIQDSPKRQKVAGQSVCFCYCFTCFKSFINGFAS